MQRTVLKNGLKVLYHQVDSNVVCIELNVCVGSNDEPSNVRGISHFIEHMLFEGTTNRPNSYTISNEIEKLGGELNAATSNERTFFYIKIAKKHFEIALEILSDIISGPLFDEKLIEKEKKIVIDEIKMVNDQPRYYQWIFFEKNLFKRHPVKNPVYGNVDCIKALTREDVLKYYGDHYKPNNMTLVIVGDVDTKNVEKRLAGMKQGKMPARIETNEPVMARSVTKRFKMDTLQSYMIIGYRSVPRSHPDSYALDIIRAIAGRGQSGKIFDEVRTKQGLAYDVGVVHNASTDFGYLAVYIGTNKKNEGQVREIVIEELQKLKNVTQQELVEAKTFLEGEFLLQTEDSQKFADLLAFWEQISGAEDAISYVDHIRKVTVEDLKQVIEKYMNHYVMSVID